MLKIVKFSPEPHTKLQTGTCHERRRNFFYNIMPFFLRFFVKFLQTAVLISSLLVNLSLTMLDKSHKEPG